MENLNRTNLRHKYIRQFLFVLLIIIGYTSCQNSGEVYSRFYELKGAEWLQNDTLLFNIDSTILNSGANYKLSIELTNNVNYPYRNIWLFIDDNFQSDSIFTNTSKEYQLADEFGKWKGSGFATTFQISLPLDDNLKLNKKRNYKIKIRHGMRDEPLKGIEKVGIRIDKNN